MGALPTAIFMLAASASALVYFFVLRFLYEFSEVKQLATAQYGVAIFYGFIFATWLGAEAGFLVARMHPQYDSIAEDEQDLVDSGSEEKSLAVGAPAARLPPESRILFLSSRHLPVLRACGEFVCIMGFIYLCDRTTLIAKGPKYVNPTAFWATNGLILLAALMTMRGGGGDAETAVYEHIKPLQRDQTEEWKGWMQIMFVLYHYFAEAEIYNAIRMYIAAYVWMTGFGNFSYYYVKKDFTAVRFCQMMWRLNFFVVFVCVTMNNEYMLYYICPMHTFFTWGVFIPLYLCHEKNSSFTVLYLKIGLTVVVSVVLYDVPGVFQAVMAPFSAILAFHDPLHPENAPMHEWFFRSGLDHLVWVFGMFCACAFPFLDSQLQLLDGLPAGKRFPAKLVLLTATLALGVWWCLSYFALPKRSYNKVHPYTSFLPIFLYLVLRNSSEWLRKRHLHLFAWCGKITLETYILQFHIWMKTTGINGSPKYLMVWIPGWFWTNFVLVSCVYIFLSFRVFYITAMLRDVVIPKEGGVALVWRGATIGAVAVAFLGVGHGVAVLTQ